MCNFTLLYLNQVNHDMETMQMVLTNCGYQSLNYILHSNLLEMCKCFDVIPWMLTYNIRIQQSVSEKTHRYEAFDRMMDGLAKSLISSESHVGYKPCMKNEWVLQRYLATVINSLFYCIIIKLLVFVATESTHSHRIANNGLTCQCRVNDSSLFSLSGLPHGGSTAECVSGATVDWTHWKTKQRRFSTECGQRKPGPMVEMVVYPPSHPQCVWMDLATYHG